MTFHDNEETMKCVIIANGDLEYTSDIVNRIKMAGLIICADGGARHLRAMRITPHVMIGDFDSIHPDDQAFFNRQKVKTLPFPAKKNHTDSDLCLSWAIDNNATDVTLLGATGTRLDHTLSNIFLLKKLDRENIPARVINHNNEIHMVTKYLELNGNKGDILSLVPITQQVTGVTLKGLEYPLVNATMTMGSSLGISNSFKDTTASIRVKNGILIVTRSID